MNMQLALAAADADLCLSIRFTSISSRFYWSTGRGVIVIKGVETRCGKGGADCVAVSSSRFGVK